MKKYLLFLLVLLWASFESTGQGRTVSGKVTSAEDGSVLPGVNVIVKGTADGTVTDAEGIYSLSAPPNAILIFTFIGLKSEEVEVGDRTTVDIALSTDVTQLTEVVVTGTGVATDKRKLGIAVESVTAEKLPAAPSGSIDQALIGKIAGAQISSISGNPGDPVNILLRGINTVQGGTKPLIIVDGVQLAATDINSLDLSNVDRVEVVQGAASAAIYGAQGANGVIQVFTKKGQKGRPVINFSTSYSTNQFLNIGDVHKARRHGYITDANNNITDKDGNILSYDEYGSIQGISYMYGKTGASEQYPNGNGATRYAIQDIRNDFNKEYGANLKYYDHFKQVFQTGYTTNNSLSISGASDKSDYAISLANNHSVSPVMKNGAVDRSNITLNLGNELFKGFKIRSTTQLVYTKNNLHPGLGAAGGNKYGFGNTLGSVNGVFSFLNTSPFFDLTQKLADGTYPGYQEAGGFLSVNAGNPFYRTEYSNQIDNKIDVIQSFDVNYTVNKFIELDAKYGLNYRTENSKWTYLNQSENINSVYYDNWISTYASDLKGEIDNWQYNNTFQNFLANAFIRTNFEDDFHLNIPIETSTQIGFDYRKRKYTELDTYGVGLSLSPPTNLQSTSDQAVAFDYTEEFVTYGYLVNQKIDIGDYGGVTAGFRSDWSSAFGGGSKPFTFPHFDGHILPSTFWKDSKLADVVPYFKVRAAYGEAGIQPNAFDRYPVLSQQNLGTGLVYTVPETSNNSGLAVEVSKETEIGTDFTVDVSNGGDWFKSITGSFTYWKRKSENVIYTVSVAPSTGSTGQLTNAIGMSSNGVQFSLNLPVYSSATMTWDFTTNWGHQVSKIDAIAGGNDIILNSGAGDASLVLTPGQIIGQIYGYKALTSVDATRANGSRYITAGTEGNYEIVDGRLVDKTTYQIQFADEKTPLANPNPKFNASFINSVSYKDFITFSFQFDWVYGSKLYNQTKEWMYRDGIHGDYEKQVTIDGKTGAFPAYWSSAYYGLFGSLNGAGNLATKDFFLEDASFLRLRNISFAFDLAKIMKIQSLKKFQLVLTGRNLLTFTDYSGFDPEISSGTVNSAFDRGVDHNTLPNTKSYQVGLNIGF
ncbi:SusC/RagA family TonB-linked outer membrane protein [Ohtaekwangia koreensis]|uniref:TonB-linked outer membrane protein, SusC/RagA family n=1 Tax=Ohtaekwangia koreensis TaxID=688867 RepID=A0A1T5ML78_9BACT|nr:SusC/RagA family TonB-linked outer membrane protein [Ohtaekwangia koreensis]SKC88744.1 TonB-linked outer membrane protein, SusC/RagA family [Ohtaekwangia koreensis]